MEQENIFRCGGVVSGESMIGYQHYLETLRPYAFVNKKSLGVSVLGLHQTGKSSLLDCICNEGAERDGFLSVYVNLHKIHVPDGANGFVELLQGIYKQTKRAARKQGIENEDFSFYEEDILAETQDSNNFRMDFEDAWEGLGSVVHLVLVLDEFDAAERFFETTDQYEFFRDIMTRDRFNTSLFLISRRELYMIEKSNKNNSTFHGAVKTINIRGFNREDIGAFYDVLEKRYQIVLTDAQKEELEYYTGVVPVLFSRFGHEMVELKNRCKAGEEIDIRGAYKELANEMKRYADTIFERLKTDGHIEKLYGTIVGPKIGITVNDIDALSALGYLLMNEQEEFYCFSQYFTIFLRNMQISVPEWERLIEVEKRIKNIVAEQLSVSYDILPEDKASYEKILNRFCYREQYNPAVYDKFIANSERNFGVKCTLIDVMSMRDALLIVEGFWNECFGQYFSNAPLRNWQEHFRRCYTGRNPLAHGHIDYLSENECTELNISCDEILKMLNCNTAIEKGKKQKPAWIAM